MHYASPDSLLAPSPPLPALALFLGVALLLIATVRSWRRDLAWSDGLLYLALTTAFFARPLLTGAIQVPVDLAYETRPFSETVATPVAVHNRRVEDTLLEQLPFHTLVRRRLLAGEAPLWSHEMGTGQPLLGNAQSAPFAPLHLLALPLPPLRALPVSAAWAMLLHLLLAHTLAHALGAGRPGAALAAVAIGLSSYSVVWAYDTLGMSAAWVPGVLLGVVLLARGAAATVRRGACDTGPGGGERGRRGTGAVHDLPGVLHPAAAGDRGAACNPIAARDHRGALAGLVVCAVGVATGGHPETLAHTALAALATALAAAWPLRASARALRRFLARLAAAAALAGMLAAPALLPFAQALPGSQRWDALEGGPDPFVPPPFAGRYLAALVDPFAFGGPFAPTLRGPLDFVEMCSGYAGAITLALALAGAAAWGGRILALIAAGLAALLAAMRVWPLFQLLSAAPLLEQATQARLRAFWVVAVALAAGLALERMPSSARGRAAMLSATGLAACTLLRVGPAAGTWEHACWALALAGLGAAALTLAVPGWRVAFTAAALAGVTAELFLLGVTYHPCLASDRGLEPPAALAFLVGQARRAPQPFRILAVGSDLPPNLAAAYGLWDPRGNDPMRPADALQLLGARLQPSREVGQKLHVVAGSFDAGFYDFLAVRYLLVRHGRVLPPPWRLAFEGRGGAVWENPRALPLFFMPRRLVRVATAEQAASASRGIADFTDLGIVADAGSAPLPYQAAGEVHGTRARSNGFDLHVISGGGIVVSSVSYDPAWQVEIDSRAAPVLEADSGFLGFAVPAGAHQVTIDYRPSGWTRGVALCGAGLLASAMLGVRGAASRRHRRLHLAPATSPAGEGIRPAASVTARGRATAQIDAA
jgi:Bacterial membrane protein YfhO